MQILDAPHLADMPDVAALLDLVAARRGTDPLSEHKRLDLTRGDAHVVIVPGDATTAAGAPGRLPDGLPACSAHVSRHGGDDPGRPVGWAVELVLHPDADPGWTAEALAATLGAVAGRGGGRLHWWVSGPTAADDGRAAAAGFAPDRDLLQMRRPLPHPDVAEVPPGVRLRGFVAGADDDAWLAVNRLAFADHPEQGAVGPADLAARLAEPWFDPEGFLLADDGDGLAGFCWTKRHPADPADPGAGVLGEIYVIGVHPARAGRGLGRVLVLAGLDHLARTGARTGMLFVDGANATAVALYERLGFHRHAHDRAYLAVVAPTTGPGAP